MADPIHHCELCGRKLGQIRIELPQDMIARIELESEMVEDPTCLRFCDQKCKKRWGDLKQKAAWGAHGSLCMCPRCLR